MAEIHPIAKELALTKGTIAALAREADVSRSWLSRIISGHVLCGYEVAHKLELALQGKVRAQDIAGWGREV